VHEKTTDRSERTDGAERMADVLLLPAAAVRPEKDGRFRDLAEALYRQRNDPTLITLAREAPVLLGAALVLELVQHGLTPDWQSAIETYGHAVIERWVATIFDVEPEPPRRGMVG